MTTENPVPQSSEGEDRWRRDGFGNVGSEHWSPEDRAAILFSWGEDAAARKILEEAGITQTRTFAIVDKGTKETL